MGEFIFILLSTSLFMKTCKSCWNSLMNSFWNFNEDFNFGINKGIFLSSFLGINEELISF